MVQVSKAIAYLHKVREFLPANLSVDVRLTYMHNQIELFNTHNFLDLGTFYYVGVPPEEFYEKFLLPIITRERMRGYL